MKWPTVLKIGGHQVSVVLDDLSKENLSGDFDPATNTIRINKEHTASQQEATLFHEVGHVMNAEWEENPMMHALLESWSQQMYAFLKDNNLLR